MKDAKQEQLIAARRNQILDAAAKVFAEKGFHPTTIKDIAREAGIADGTIYIYFPNKPALLLGILERMKETVQQEVDPAPLAGMDLHTFVRTYLHYPLTVFEASNFELFRVVLSEIMVNQDVREQYYRQILEPTIALAERYFQQWAEQNGVAPVHSKLLLHTISGLVLGMIVQRIIGDATLEAHWPQLPDMLSDLLLNGLRGEHT